MRSDASESNESFKRGVIAGARCIDEFTDPEEEARDVFYWVHETGFDIDEAITEWIDELTPDDSTYEIYCRLLSQRIRSIFCGPAFELYGNYLEFWQHILGSGYEKVIGDFDFLAGFATGIQISWRRYWSKQSRSLLAALNEERNSTPEQSGAPSAVTNPESIDIFFWNDFARPKPGQILASFDDIANSPKFRLVRQFGLDYVERYFKSYAQNLSRYESREQRDAYVEQFVDVAMAVHKRRVEIVGAI